MNRCFYHHAYLDGRIIGSKNPFVFGGREFASTQCRGWGITHVLVLSKPAPSPEDLPAEIHHHHILLIPRRSDIDVTNRIIGSCLASDGRIWTDCEKGIDRTGCVIGCYLVSIGRDPDDVFNILVANAATKINHPNLRALLSPSYGLIYEYANRTKMPV